jgi:hypothetical protein
MRDEDVLCMYVIGLCILQFVFYVEILISFLSR